MAVRIDDAVVGGVELPLSADGFDDDCRANEFGHDDCIAQFVLKLLKLSVRSLRNLVVSFKFHT